MSSAADWRLFPPPIKPGPPSIGDEVFVRTKSAKEIGKKGVVFAFEKVEAPRTLPLEPAVSTVPPPPPPPPPPPMAESVDAFSGSSTCSARVTTVWREAKKQKKKKKPKKWEETRAVVRVPGGGEDNPFDCRARPSRLVPIYGVPPTAGSSAAPATDSARPLLLLLTAETLPYRLLAASQVRPSDRVLEVGCSTGETTVVLAKYVPRGCVVALDVGADMVERTKHRLRLASADARVAVHKIDPFLDPRGAVDVAESAVVPGGEHGSDERSTDTGKGCGGGGNGVGGGGGDSRREHVDAVFIDIGGNREVRGVVRMIAFARTAFAAPPRLIVVKSQALVAELKARPNAGKRAGDADETTPSGAGEAGCYADCGTISEGDSWFLGLLARSSEAPPSGGGRAGKDIVHTSDAGPPQIPKHFHPNKAPLRLSPTDGVTPICRYHNYHKGGCKKGDRCPFDHAFCHWCLRTGHIALNCDNISEFSAPR